MPGGGDSDSLIGIRSKCTMFYVPRRSEAAAADASRLAVGVNGTRNRDEVGVFFRDWTRG